MRRKGARRAIGLAGALLLATVAGCGTVIRSGHMGLKSIALDEPALQKKPRPEGFYFQWPWNDMIIYDTTWQSRDEDVEVLTADDLHVPTTVTVTYRARAEELYRLETEIGQSYYEDVIRPAFVTLVRSELARYNHNDLARKSPDMELAIHTKLAKTLEGKPIDLDHIAIKHIRFDRSVTEAISQKLVSEQRAEQKRFDLDIAKQDAEIDRERARGAGDALRLRAEGEAQAIVLKGKAQAEAQAAITKTLDKAYLQYKAFDGPATRYYFVPVGKDGMPIIVDTASSPRGSK